ncbi:methyl-accepting chemotaxis protein [Desulfobulbus rhabdoformis]|uniref:methyl-accepting chemotaxis protein n=1 Tax=Desulfobulbus rhabdoformis TaxID=34032 RepID=UPI001964C887|nr:methyl-accepting chemotaxis protein [Desulfobulbus rhabdoformis]MBM9617014.1 methyl-accepting chemotaxis protein [Desulfobulbus rhabdoformis]
MKNFTLGVKLIGGFLATAMIILFVGLLSIRQQSALGEKVEQLGSETIPAIENILIIKSELNSIASLMHSLLTPYATKKERQQTHKTLIISRQIYSTAKEKFMQLPLARQFSNEWNVFITNVNKWAHINNEAVELSQQLVAMDIIHPPVMKHHMDECEISHRILLTQINKLIGLGLTFEGKTNAEECALGKWFQELNTTNPDIIKLVDELKPFHTKLHRMTAEIQNLCAIGQTEQAKKLYEQEILPISQRIFELLHQISAIVDKADTIFSQMNQLVLEDGVMYQSSTLSAIDYIVKQAENQSKVTVKDAQNSSGRGQSITTICLVIGFVLAIVLGVLLTRLITKPLIMGIELAKAMAQGDLTQSMRVQQTDEIGLLAISLNKMAQNLRSMFAEIKEGVTYVDESSIQLAAISNQVSSGTESSAIRSAQVSAAAEEMSSNQNSIATAMEEASVNVDMVAAAAEEMNATITEIAMSSSKAIDITATAVQQSLEASERVNELGRAADEINKVTEAITEISEQTNLLALNATIEAARAGEAGKGFAVVANEIKDLAKQTAMATLDIKNKIKGIQEATGLTVSEINEISSIISEVDQMVTTIASAMEEQSATTREIATNVNQASQGIKEVNQNVAQSSTVSSEIASDIATVSESTNEISAAIHQVKVNAESLRNISGRLNNSIEKFKI